MKTKKEWLVGQWQIAEEKACVILVISQDGNGFKVRAFDKSDNEEFEVSKTTWNGKCLQFETYMPSTKWRTRNCLTLVSKTKLIQELTFWETWKKIKQVRFSE